MTIVKPLRLGLLARAHREPPKTRYFVAALGFFDLVDPSDFDLETQMWPAITPYLGQEPLDAAMPKPAGEVLIQGEACAPAGEKVRQQVVDVRVGTIAKRLVVFGDRHWHWRSDGVTFTQPEPFTRMPIGWDRAFGGAGTVANPVGVGADAAEALRQGRPAPLPNVEHPDALILSPQDRPPPAGIAPLAIDHPERMARVGTYDAAYLEERFPGHAADFDWSFYNTAPRDQWIDGFFTGTESYRLVGMHPERPIIHGRLPGMRVRAFLNLDRGEAGTELVELSMRCETIWLFPSILKGVIIYRGGTGIRDIDGLDVKDTMLAYERLSDPPRSADHYRRALAERSAGDEKALKFFDEKPLRPDLTDVEREQRAAERADVAAEDAEKREKRAAFAVTNAFKLAGLPPPPAAALPKPAPPPGPMPVISPKDIERMDLDLAGIIGAAKQLGQTAMAEAKAAKDAALAELGAWLGDLEKQGGSVMTAVQRAKLAQMAAKAPKIDPTLPKPPGLPSLPPPAIPDLAATLEQALPEEKLPGKLAEVTAKAGLLDLPEGVEAGGGDAAATDAAKALARARALGLPEGKLLADALDGLKGIDLEAMAARADSGVEGAPDLAQALLTPTAPQTVDAPGDADAFLASIGLTLGKGGGDLAAKSEAATGAAADALKQVAEQAPLAAHAMAVAQPDGVPKPPAEAIEEATARIEIAQDKVDEAMVKIRRLSPEAVFPLEPMAKAVSEDLGAFIRRMRAYGESLAGRDLAGAHLPGIDLSGLDLRGVMLERADLRGARFVAADLRDAVFTNAVLDEADFSGAIMTGANLSAASASHARFHNADLRDIRGMKADFTGADLSGAKLEGTQFIETGFIAADLTGATLERVIAIKVLAAGMKLDGARLEASMFLESDLTGLSARKAVMHRCVFLKTPAQRSDFSGATVSGSAFLSGAELDGSVFRDLEGTNSGWHGASLKHADFHAARLDAADLGEADLSDANLSRAGLRRANLGSTVLLRADLSGANLYECIARRANLVHASLRRANLYFCNLDDADLRFCDLTGANLANTRLTRPSNVA